METRVFDPDIIVEYFKMPYHLASAFRVICSVAATEKPEERLRLMGLVQEHVDNELIRLRAILQKPKDAPQPERLFGAVLDPDYGLAEDALLEAYQLRDSLKAQKEGQKK
jgi:hypothetical protein